MAPIRNSMLENLKHAPVTNPTSWKKSICIEATETPGEYRAEAYPDWTFGGVLHGGVIFALCVEAAKLHCRSNESTKGQTDAVSSNVTFLRPTRVGPIRIIVHTLKLGPQYSNFRVSLGQNNPKTGLFRQSAEAQIIVGSLARASTDAATLKLPPSNKPLHVDITKTKPSRDGWQVETMSRIKVPFYTTKNYVCLHPPGQELEDSSRSHPVYGQFVRENWWKADEPWTIAHLPYLLDLGTPMHMNFQQGADYWGPTLTMSMDLKKLPPQTFHKDGEESGSEWLFQQVELEESKDGRLLMNMLIKDEEGDILAIIRTLTVAVPYHKVGRESGSNSKDSKL